MLDLKSLRTANYPFALTVAYIQAALEAGSFPTQQAKKDLNEIIGRCYENDTRKVLNAMPELRTGEEGALSHWDVPMAIHEFGKKAHALFAADIFAPYIAQVDELNALRAAIKEAPIVKPAPRLAHVNPNKDVKTCPCCFRAIAVQGKTMAHHGYQRTGHGFQTASCMGIHYRPLEVSDEGLRAMIRVYTKKIDDANAEIALWSNPETTQKMMVKTKTSEVVYVRGTPEFDKQLRIFMANKESELRQAGYSLKFFEEKLSTWKAAA